MKKTAIILCFVLAAAAVYSEAIQEERGLSDETSRASYAFGMSVGKSFNDTSLKLDYAAFMDGLRTIMEGAETKISEEEAQELVQKAFEAAVTAKTEEARIKEELFLSTNAVREDITVTESGLQYEVITEGTGPKPVESDTVRVHYEGTLIDGTVFDSSYEGEPAELPLNVVIPGWTEGVQLMNTGSTYRLFIPSKLAYGENGNSQIPPWTTLIFTVELLEILPPAEEPPNFSE